jgi:hypothetical protein
MCEVANNEIPQARCIVALYTNAMCAQYGSPVGEILSDSELLSVPLAGENIQRLAAAQHCDSSERKRWRLRD